MLFPSRYSRENYQSKFVNEGDPPDCNISLVAICLYLRFVKIQEFHQDFRRHKVLSIQCSSSCPQEDLTYLKKYNGFYFRLTN